MCRSVVLGTDDSRVAVHLGDSGQNLAVLVDCHQRTTPVNEPENVRLPIGLDNREICRAVGVERGARDLAVVPLNRARAILGEQALAPSRIRPNSRRARQLRKRASRREQKGHSGAGIRPSRTHLSELISALKPWTFRTSEKLPKHPVVRGKKIARPRAAVTRGPGALLHDCVPFLVMRNRSYHRLEHSRL